jgi:hypothetical protein
MKTNLILIGIIAVLLAGIYFVLDFGIKEKKERKEKELILSSRERQLINDSLQHASVVSVWQLNYSELEKYAKKEASLRSDFENKCVQMYNDIELYKRKNKDLIHYTSYNITSKDTFLLPMPAVCDRIVPIKTEHVNIEFIYDSLELLTGINHEYRARQNILITLFPKRKENGKKHFPNWGNLPWVGWDEVSIATIDDKNAVIDNQISVEFKR